MQLSRHTPRMNAPPRSCIAGDSSISAPCFLWIIWRHMDARLGVTSTHSWYCSSSPSSRIGGIWKGAADTAGSDTFQSFVPEGCPGAKKTALFQHSTCGQHDCKWLQGRGQKQTQLGANDCSCTSSPSSWSREYIKGCSRHSWLGNYIRHWMLVSCCFFAACNWLWRGYNLLELYPLWCFLCLALLPGSL